MMRLAVPAALWLLALLPLIVLLYMLRSRRQDVPVSALLLWQRARRDLAAQLPVRRLERNLLLLLQLLAVLLLAAALSRPHVALPAPGGSATVLIMDVSASMQATDVAPSRFAAARALAAEDTARAGGPVMVIAAAAQPRVVAPFGDPGAARTALARLAPTDTAANLDQAVAVALAQRPAGRMLRVVVFTDRAAAPVPGVTYRVVGRVSRNIGVTSLRTARIGNQTHAVIRVTNAGVKPERVPLVVSIDGRRLAERSVTIAAGSTAAVTVTAPGTGVLRAQIEPHDALAVDDAAVAIAGLPAPRVVVLGMRDRALEAALAAIPAAVIGGPQPESRAMAAADVIVLNQTPPADLPPGNYLLIGTVATNLPITAGGVLPHPQVVRWSRSHPVTRYVDLEDAAIARALLLRPRGGEVLASGETPLIWAYEGGGVRAVVMGFSLADTDLPLAVGFPILLSNAVGWLAGDGAALEAGATLTVPAGGQQEATLTDPQGGRTAIPARGGMFVAPVLERAGVYALAAGDRTHRIGVNPPAAETEIAPVLPPEAPGEASTEAVRQQHAVDLAPLLVALALLVFLFEWAMWLRGLPRTNLGRVRAVVRR